MPTATPTLEEALINPLAGFDDLMTEAEVCECYASLLSERELRQARRKGEVAFVTGKKGMIHYRPAALAQYLERKVTKCQPQQLGSGNTADTGSAAPLAPTISMSAGGTSEQNERVVEVLTRKFSPRPKTSSSLSLAALAVTQVDRQTPL
jgi:hypothetical protein